MAYENLPKNASANTLTSLKLDVFPFIGIF